MLQGAGSATQPARGEAGPEPRQARPWDHAFTAERLQARPRPWPSWKSPQDFVSRADKSGCDSPDPQRQGRVAPVRCGGLSAARPTQPRQAGTRHSPSQPGPRYREARTSAGNAESWVVRAGTWPESSHLAARLPDSSRGERDGGLPRGFTTDPPGGQHAGSRQRVGGWQPLTHLALFPESQHLFLSGERTSPFGTAC